MPTELKKASENDKDIHSVSLRDRSKAVLTGVTDVIEFAEDNVRLKTVMGDMIIKGSSLTISRLDTLTGTLEVNGSVDCIQYKMKQKGGFFAGLLK